MSWEAPRLMSKLYVLVRTDLSWQHRAVQAGHAVAEFLKKHPGTTWENGILVYLRVRNEEELAEFHDRFEEGPHFIRYAEFFEEDMDNQLTAIAATGVDELVKDLALL